MEDIVTRVLSNQDEVKRISVNPNDFNKILEREVVASLNELTKSTKVVCTTVGPYAKYGSKLVQACIENKSHYCDLASLTKLFKARK